MAGRPGPLSGFPELLPAQRYVEQRVVETLTRAFELHGFAGVETRAVEPLEQLLRKGETSKEVYVLRRLQAGDTDEEARLGLHFDLTVPFARYVLEHAGKLEFPFRRYQVQKVWRGERPQEGRFREFLQADVDVVGRDTLAFHHDVEIARVMVDALSRLDFLPRLRLQVNNRKLLQGFFAGLGAPDPEEAMRVLDKRDHLAEPEVTALLVERAGLDPERAGLCLALAGITAGDTGFVHQVEDLGVEDDLLTQGVEELATVLDGCRDLASDRVEVVADLSVARGLDYYTGTVFETRMLGHEALGSICSGGRYDALASDGRTTYPGVGLSLGVSRLLVPLLQRGELAATRPVPSAVLVAVPDEESRRSCDDIAGRLRARGIPAEVAPSAAKYGKQIRYAERRGIPFVWFPDGDGGGEVKDIRSGDQGPADPDTWAPPDQDRWPRTTTSQTAGTAPADRGDQQ